ncbi:hypothetical protein AB870_24370 (plasmid) [Pandoraea faecigallinarum]|uniref:Uncharacterized protein n=1 Tax=Pandoraea faecigallinarum TaxID=656179 RepID=A0A0H3X029_9BURK|nr:hypothetical protein AB870_24370 [Pandoraea faecigallinarum]
MRRRILEKYEPVRLDIERLLEGESREFRLLTRDLRSVAQVLNALYARIVESDLLPSDERGAMVERILPALAESETKQVDVTKRDIRKYETNSSTATR